MTTTDSVHPTFLAAREDWLRVETIDRPGGGWDVVLRIDGTYFGETFAARRELVAYFEEWINDELRGGKCTCLHSGATHG